jgi:hypothetical protein
MGEGSSVIYSTGEPGLRAAAGHPRGGWGADGMSDGVFF